MSARMDGEYLNSGMFGCCDILAQWGSKGLDFVNQA